MDAETREALKASIAKWERNVSVKSVAEARIKGDDCPLCTLFFDGDEGLCAGCPVAQKVGNVGCNDTPWEAACEAFYGGGLAAFKAAARKEVAFLKSLLPAEEPAA